MEYEADARKGIYPHRDATSPYTIAVERGYSEIVAVIEQEEARRGGVTSAPERKYINSSANGDDGGSPCQYCKRTRDWRGATPRDPSCHFLASGDAREMQLTALAAGSWRRQQILPWVTRSHGSLDRVTDSSRRERRAGCEVAARTQGLRLSRRAVQSRWAMCDWLRGHGSTRRARLENPLHWPFDGLKTITKCSRIARRS